MKFSELNKRLMVAAVGIPAIIFLILAGHWWTVAFTTFITTGFVVEFNSLLKKNKQPLFLKLLLIPAVSWPVLVFLQLPVIWYLLYWSIIFIAILMTMIIPGLSDPLKSNAYAFFIIIYGILFPSSLVFLREHAADLFSQPYLESGKLILAWLILIWICDTTAYVGGKNFGKRKLAPTISPNKTIEGFLWGITATILMALLMEKFDLIFLDGIQTIGVALIIGTMGQVGDLIESRIKRLLQVKDSSQLLPGHGGVMDRFDSLVFTAPFIVIYLILISL